MLLDNNTVIKVTNRANSYVGYSIPESGVKRRFAPGETKEILLSELRQLQWVPGGSRILNHYLIMDNVDAVNELVYNVQPEYYYTSEEVRALLMTGSLDQLLDCLDFAPAGVIQLVKDISVEIELNDVSKRKAIFDKTGFNVTKAIEINQLSAEPETENTELTARRAEPVVQAQPTARRAATPSAGYQVVKK